MSMSALKWEILVTGPTTEGAVIPVSMATVATSVVAIPDSPCQRTSIRVKVIATVLRVDPSNFRLQSIITTISHLYILKQFYKFVCK